MSKFRLLKFIAKYFSLDSYRKAVEFFRYYVIGLYHRIDEHHIFLSGGGVAFSLLLSIIPILLLAFAILGNIINPVTLHNQISNLIDTIIPYPEYAAYTKKVILTRLPEVIEYKTLAAYLGAIGLFFTSTWLFSSMRTILNKVYKVEKTRSVWVGLLRDFGMVILLIFLILLSTFIFPIANVLLNSAKEIELLKMFIVTDFINSLFSVASVIVIFTLFFLFYMLIPYEKINRKALLVSAFWATLLWELARKIFEFYIAHFLSSNKLYGAFVLIIVVLFWIFYSSCLFIVGAEIGQLYREKLLKKKSDSRTDRKLANRGLT